MIQNALQGLFDRFNMFGVEIYHQKPKQGQTSHRRSQAAIYTSILKGYPQKESAAGSDPEGLEGKPGTFADIYKKTFVDT